MGCIFFPWLYNQLCWNRVEKSSTFNNEFLPFLQAVPETITEDFCGIEPVTLPPEEEETRRPPDVDEEAIKHYYSATNPILGTILAILFILGVIIVMAIIKQKNRHKGEYLTREDEGAHDAFDADTAVLQGRTGHHVEKKREWLL